MLGRQLLAQLKGGNTFLQRYLESAYAERAYFDSNGLPSRHVPRWLSQ